MSEEELKKLREDIDDIDKKIIELLSERIEVAGDILKVKKKMEKGIRDREREQKVIERTREYAREKGLDPDFAEDVIRLTISRTVGSEQEQVKRGEMWEKIRDFFEESPAQLKIARVLYKYGLRVKEDGDIVCGEIRIPAIQIAEEAGVDRRTVASTAKTILGNGELREIFSNLRPIPFLKGVARPLNLGLIEIIPTDATETGIISEVTDVISENKLSVRQSITDDPYFTAQPRFTIITSEPVPGKVIEELRDLPSIESVIVY